LHAKIQNKKVENIMIGAGGIAATPIRLLKTENYLRGKVVDDKIIQEACIVAQKEFQPISDVRSSASYRRVVFENTLSRILGGLQ
jgi:xanthine dehydrogenase small subunit